MDDNATSSSQTLAASDISASVQRGLDLSSLPPIFVSPTHLDTEALHDLEEQLTSACAHLTYDINEARIILSKVVKKARVLFDLRSKGLWAEEVPPQDVRAETPVKQQKAEDTKSPVRETVLVEALDDSTTASESDGTSVKVSAKRKRKRGFSSTASLPKAERQSSGDEDKDSLFSVINLNWLSECQKQGRTLRFNDFLTLHARRISKPALPATPQKAIKIDLTSQASPAQSILERAKEDAPSQAPSRLDRFGTRKFNSPSKSTAGATWEAGHGSSHRQFAHLIHATTSEAEEGYSSDLPEMPDWVRQNIKYACQRSTPRVSPNTEFIDLLKKIKLARVLANDEIGVRAYSTSIASLAAYPYKLSNPREILALPGCDVKLANLFVEWMNTGKLKAVEDLEADEELNVLKLFYNIWGVGSITAREFYYDRGWRDLDDIIEHGWKTLSRVQQIGVKYYEEFLDPIPRIEVEKIGQIVQRHAVRVRDERIQTLIVGGYRRGNETCGDVDILVSHPDEAQTMDLVSDIVSSLEDEEWITHTLLLSLHSTHRDQKTLPFRTSSAAGAGFDSLDKALVVWQEPDWPTKASDRAADSKAKNPNIHRRVDIIISPWRTVGCAVLGWSGGNTFERDLRRLAKNEKKWKFDSSGLRSRVNGEVVDVEGFFKYDGTIGKGRATTMEEAEKRVFEGMGLVYREPTERCTG